MSRPTSPFSAVIFDLDGTLTTPGLIDFAAMRRDIGCPPAHDILDHMAHLEASAPERAAAAWAAIEHHELAGLSTAAPNVGLHDALGALHQRGLGLGVLTRNSRRTLDHTLERLAIHPLLPARVAREDARPKPHPDGVLKLAEALGSPPAHTLVVGDYRHDVSAGHAAGAWTAWLRPRATDEVPAHTDFVLARLTDVIAVIDLAEWAWTPPVKVSIRGR